MWNKVNIIIGVIIESAHILFVIPTFAYLFFALIGWSFNPLNWSTFGQIAAALVIFVILFVFATLVKNTVQLLKNQ